MQSILQKMWIIFDNSKIRLIFDPNLVLKTKSAMLTMFSKKKEDANAQELNAPKFITFQANHDVVLAKSELSELKGGRTASRIFTRFFSWNSSCGGSVPQ
jgi:hypothetical protein